jgi:HNH endonuclease
MGTDILAKVERRWPRRRHELGPCLVWTGAQTTDSAGRTYGRFYDAAIGRTDYTHRVVWRRVYGPIPPLLQVDHVCEITLCQRPDHLELVSQAGVYPQCSAPGRDTLSPRSRGFDGPVPIGHDARPSDTRRVSALGFTGIVPSPTLGFGANSGRGVWNHSGRRRLQIKFVRQVGLPPSVRAAQPR